MPKGKPKNPKPTLKQEAFLLALLKGIKQRDAYREAYPASREWKDCTVDSAASKLMKLDYIQARYADLQEKLIVKAADKGIMTAAEVLVETSRIAKAKVTNYLKVETIEYITGYKLDKEGKEDKTQPITRTGQFVRAFDTDDIPEELLGAVAAIKQGRNGIEIKLHDKTKALELLGKHHKLFEDTMKHEHTGEINVIFTIPRPPKQQAQEGPTAEEVGKDE